MSLFASPDEARDVGVPLVRLHRAAIGRDPGAEGMAAMVSAWRLGIDLPEIAGRLLDAPEGRRLHGHVPSDAPADAPFFARAGGSGRTMTGGPLDGMTRRDALAALALIALPDEPPALPALFLDCAPDDPVAYAFWLRSCEPEPSPLPSGLLLRLEMYVGDSEAEAALVTFDSLIVQTHVRWELSVLSRVLSPWGREVLVRMAADPRVRLTQAGAAPRADDPPGATVPALTPGDRLAPRALACIAATFDADPEATLVVTDEDEMDAAGRRSRPRFRPGRASGRTGFRAERSPRAAGADAVRHLPFMLFHPAEPVEEGPVLTAPRARLPSPAPLVSVLLPTRDRPDLLRAVADGVLRRTAYEALELVIVDHETTEQEAAALLDELARDRRVRILPWPGAFNFAAMNNRAASRARGQVLLLLNNDVEIGDPGWLAEMAAQAMRPDAGAVGARLLARDGTIQHAGIALGPGGQARHVMQGAAADDPGYLGLLSAERDVAAVTGACLAIRRDVWDRVGGMDQGFPVAWNDVDLCQRVRAAGLRVIWTPHATLAHLEGETRGRDAEDPARLAAFEAARERYRAIWGAAADEDPFLNPNLVPLEGGLRLAPAGGWGRLPWTRT